MSKETYNKYLKFEKRSEINRNPGLKWCPTTDCEGYLVKPISAENLNIEC
jgi:IBR domain, a half RING-finger domain